MIKNYLKRLLQVRIASTGWKQNAELPLLTRKIAFSASTENTDKAKEARGAISFYFIQFIKQFQNINYIFTGKSIRNLLLDEVLFYNYMLRKVQLINKNISNLSDLYKELPREYYEQVSNAYRVHEGAPIDIEVYSQERTKNVRNKKYNVALNPISITAKYFNILSSRTNNILSGQKGTGKSFSFVGYNYLSSLLLQYRLSQLNNPSKFSGLITQKQAAQIPMICYITMTDRLEPSSYFHQIMLQYKHILSLQQFNKQKLNWLNKTITLEDLFDLLKEIQFQCSEKDIKNTIIIDQANRIFRVFRTLKNLKAEEEKNQSTRSNELIVTNQREWKWMKSQAFSVLKFYSDLIQIFIAKPHSKFNSIIFNSSQDFQIKNIQSTFKIIQDKCWLIKFLGKLRIMDENVKMNYTEFIQNPFGQIQLFNCFWFQIQRYIQKKDVGNKITVPIEQLTEKYRDSFQEVFKIDKIHRQQILKMDNNNQTHIIETWKNDVRHLHIRKYFLLFSNLLSQNILSDFVPHPTKDQLNLFKKQVIQVKKKIQQYRKNFIIQDIKEYLIKGVAQKETKQRLNAIKCIESEIRNNQVATDGHYCSFQCKQIPLHKRDDFIEKIGFGYNNTANQTLRFSIDQKSFKQIFQELKNTKEYTFITMDHFMYLLMSRMAILNNAFHGQMFNNYLFFQFQSQLFVISLKYKQNNSDQEGYFTHVVKRTVQFRGFTSIMTDKQYEEYLKKKKTQQTYQQKYQFISIHNPKPELYSMQTQRHFPITQMQLRKQFAALIQIANKEKQQGENYIGASPVNYSSNKSKFVSCNNQTIFDQILFRKTSTLQFIFIDWTLGRPNSKGVKEQQLISTFKKYRQFFLKLKNILNLDEEVKCSMMIAAPQYYVSNYHALDYKEGNWEIQMRLASFDQKLPFKTQDEVLNQMGELFKQIYKYGEKVVEKNNEYYKQKARREQALTKP